MTDPNPSTLPLNPDDVSLGRVAGLFAEIKNAQAELNYPQVVDLCRAALERLAALGEVRDQARAMRDSAYRALIEALERTRRFEEANDALSAWQAAATRVQTLVDAIVLQARIYNRMGRCNEAFTLLDMATSQAEEEQYLRGLGQAIRERANVFWALGNGEQAVLMAKQALAIAEQLGHVHLQADSHLTLGLCQLLIGDYDQAVAHTLRSAQLFETLDDRYYMGVLYTNLGEIYQSLFDMQNALRYHQRAQKLFSEDKLSIDLMRNLGVDLVGVGEVEQGMDYLRRALNESRQHGERNLYYQALYSLAEAHLALGSVPVAQELAEELLDEVRPIEATQHIIRASMLLGHCARAQGRTARARELYHEGFAAAQHTGDRTVLWQMHAALAALLKDEQPDMAVYHRRMAQDMAGVIAASLDDDRLREVFMNAAPVRALLSG